MLQTGWLFLCSLIFLTFGCHCVGAASIPEGLLDPTVILDNATVTGVFSGLVNKFLGIPFAHPPTGDLRFRLPKPLPPYSTSFDAKAFGPACPQQAFKFPTPSFLPKESVNYLANSVYKIITPFSEDCLTLNVVAPITATPASKLPVVVWIFGGGFQIGGPDIYDGGIIVSKSILLGVPAVYVSLNHRKLGTRVSAFGFLASQEVKDAGVGNLGLQDQRLALQWVQKYIAAFGGDPAKVTIWGESSGAISVGLHMVTNGGNPDGLFRAAFMESGSPVPVGPITKGQPYYDALVAATGCSGSGNTLQCLRTVPYETLLDAVNQSPMLFSYQSLALAWLPRVDGVFLTDHPQRLVQQGSVANIPFITGDCDDEATLFSFSTLNVTTDTQFKEYLHTYWFPEASDAEITQLATYYPSDPSRGSPFGTGDLYALGTPQFKRFAAIQGDGVFQAPRRFFIKNRADKQRIWTYVSRRLKTLPYLGSFHTSDILNVYFGQDMTSYLVRFVTNLDPNVGLGTDIFWPQYDTVNQKMLVFKDGFFSTQSLTTDTYRTEEMEYFSNLTLRYPL